MILRDHHGTNHLVESLGFACWVRSTPHLAQPTLQGTAHSKRLFHRREWWMWATWTRTRPCNVRRIARCLGADQLWWCREWWRHLMSVFCIWGWLNYLKSPLLVDFPKNTWGFMAPYFWATAIYFVWFWRKKPSWLFRDITRKIKAPDIHCRTFFRDQLGSSQG